MKKIICFIVIICCLLFTGCGEKESRNVQSEVTEYVSNVCGVPNLQGTINSTLRIDSKLYAGVYTKQTAVRDGRYCVVIYDIVEGTNERILLQGKEEMVMWCCTVLENGNYKALFLTWDAEKESYPSLCLITFDQQGKMVEEQDIAQEFKKNAIEGVSLNSFYLDRTGDLYFYSEINDKSTTSQTTKLYCVRNGGGLEHIKEYSGKVLELQTVFTHVLIVMSNLAGELEVFDLSSGEADDKVNIELGVDAKSFRITEGLSDTQMIIDQGGVVYLYDSQSQQLTKLYSYEDVGLEYGTNNTKRIHATNQDEYYAIVSVSEEGEVYDWIRITKSNVQKQKEILTIAVSQSSSSLKEAVTDFNRTSENYKVVIKEYEKEGKYGISTQLQADIIAGNIPDMMAVDIIDLEVMANKNMLHDLSDLLNKDKEISFDDFVGSSLEIYVRDDELYAIPQYLGVSVLTGKQKDLQGVEGWTIDEFREYVHSLPDEKAATSGISKSMMLDCILEQYLYQFVDWESKNCFFEREGFTQLLEFVNMYPDECISLEMDADKWLEMFYLEKISLYPWVVSNFSDLQLMKSMYGDEIAFVGYPTAEGHGMQLLSLGEAYVITESSAYKEEMWQIMKKVITDPMLHTTGSFPAYCPEFNKACEVAMVKNMVETSDGSSVEEPIYTVEFGKMPIEIYASTESDVTMLKDLLEKAESTKSSSVVIKDIIREEAMAYFSGQKELDMVVDIIQNRVKVYLNE